MVKKYEKAVFVLLAVLVLDYITKSLAKEKLAQPFVLVKDFLSFTYVENKGAGFGLLQGQTWLLIAISVIVLGVIIYYSKKIEENQIIPVALIVGGLVGNLVERIFIGHVTDFIDFQIWPVFNVADSCLTVGVVWLIVLTFIENRKK